MDGVTDAAFRHMVCKESRPSFVMTEFVNVEGLARGALKKMPAFLYEEAERPIVAQIFGVEVESFYKAAFVVGALGFDGIDINMGCPAKKVEKKGSGAGLIKTPELAVEIIEAVQRGMRDWAAGMSLEKAGVNEEIIDAIGDVAERREFPVSVKTRIGYGEPVTEDWISRLLETGIDALILHGRTLKQMYMGEADWGEIGKAARLCRDAGVFCIGNGDVSSMEEAADRVRDFGVDGVLVGRAVMGNPWFFGGEWPAEGEEGKVARLRAAREHLEYYRELGYGPFHAIKKHLGWYVKGFKGSRQLRVALMECQDFEAARLLLVQK